MKSQDIEAFNPIAKIKYFFDTSPQAAALLFVFSAVLWLNLRTHHPFHYDSALYWDLRLQFDRQNTAEFSLLHYTNPLRSYLLPWIHYAISKAALAIGVHEVTLLEIVQALVFSGLITIVIPGLIKIAFNRPVTFWQIITFGLLVIFFWRGYFYYPLSDFWALFFCLTGIYIFLRYCSTSWALLLTGACWAGALLIRPSYVPSIILLPFWAIFYLRKYLHLKFLQLAFRFVLMILGLIGICAPQVLINLVHFDKFSPLPQTQVVYGGNLFMKQVSWGIQVQRYETFVGEKSEYPSPSAVFVDPHGETILAQSGLGPYQVGAFASSFLTLPEYIRLLVRHPLDFFVLYLRHLFNGLDVVYNTPYVYNLYENTIPIRLINYSLWFLVILFINKCIRASAVFSDQFVLLLIFIIPSLLSIPTAIEVRFMLPFSLMAYSILAFYVIPLIGSFPRQKQVDLSLKYALWYIAFLSICLTLSSSTFSNLKDGMYIF